MNLIDPSSDRLAFIGAVIGRTADSACAAGRFFTLWTITRRDVLLRFGAADGCENPLWKGKPRTGRHGVGESRTAGTGVARRVGDRAGVRPDGPQWTGW